MSPAEDVSRKYRQRLSAVEVAALCMLVVAVTVPFMTRVVFDEELSYGRQAVRELSPLKVYGPQRSSEDFEEWIIRDYFQDRKGGVFLDVGANHHQVASNTYYLETQLGWSGVAVDALPEFAAGYATYRPRTRFVAMFASDVSDATVQFFVPDNSLVSSSSQEFTERYGTAGKLREVPTTTLNEVLKQAGIERIDLLSMDIELAEPKALAGFDIERFQPALVCIEAHPEVRQQILSYFAQRRYVLVGKYLRADSRNLYFEPLR